MGLASEHDVDEWEVLVREGFGGTNDTGSHVLQGPASKNPISFIPKLRKEIAFDKKRSLGFVGPRVEENLYASNPCRLLTRNHEAHTGNAIGSHKWRTEAAG